MEQLGEKANRLHTLLPPFLLLRLIYIGPSKEDGPGGYAEREKKKGFILTLSSSKPSQAQFKTILSILSGDTNENRAPISIKKNCGQPPP